MLAGGVDYVNIPGAYHSAGYCWTITCVAMDWVDISEEIRTCIVTAYEKKNGMHLYPALSRKYAM